MSRFFSRVNIWLFFYFHIVMDAALSVASCVHVSTSWAPFIESNLIQTLPTLPVSPCYNCNRQHRPNIAVTLQMSHSSFPPCWRKTELVIKAHQIRDDPCFEAPIFFCHSSDESLLSQHSTSYNPPESFWKHTNQHLTFEKVSGLIWRQHRAAVEYRNVNPCCA